MSGETVRWWPAMFVLLAGGTALLAIWRWWEPSRQDQVLASMALGLAVAVALLAWLLFASRAGGSVRLLVLSAVALAVVLGLFLIRFTGVSGDLVPQWEWRWGTSAGVRFAEPAPAATGVAGEFPGFLGPRRDGVVHGAPLATDWDERPPRELWRIPMGEGWSGFAVSGGRAVTQEQYGSEERVTCYDLETGRLLWSHADETRWEDSLGGPGPRATPTVAGGHVFALGATGLLNVLDLATGEVVWSRNVLSDHGASPPTYGVASSPLVVDDRVVVMAGGAGASLAAYDVADGRLRWAAGDDGAGYSSPALRVLHGVPQIVVLTADHVLAHDLDDGRILWQREWPGDTQRAANPVVLPDARVVASTGYGVGAKLLAISRDDAGFSVATVWESRALKAKFANFVHLDGYLYGLDDGILTCVSAADGSRVWKNGRYGHGQLLLTGGLLLVLSERGDVALVDATPEEYRQLAVFGALHAKTWNHPALAGSRLLVRNDREAAAYLLPLLHEP